MTAPTWFVAPCDAVTESVADVHLFRTQVTAQPGEQVTVRIAADSRYKLRVNGVLLSVGPAKPRRSAWFFDHVDIGPALHAGVNTITVEVLSYRSTAYGNFSVGRRFGPALLIEGAVGDRDLNDAGIWRVARMPVTISQGLYTVFLGIQETASLSSATAGVHGEDFDDTEWAAPSAHLAAPGFPAPAPDPLLPRPTPPLALEDVSLVGARTVAGDIDATPLLSGGAVTVPAGIRAVIDLDVGVLVTAQLSLDIDAPADTTVELLAAECYEYEPIFAPWARRKGDRADAANGDLYGDPDVVRIGDDGPHRYEPFWYRTVRYLRLTLDAASGPVTISRLRLTRIQADLDTIGTFTSDLPLDAPLWDVSERTLRACMHDTFEDCPYYEQLQYAMDTRSQALFVQHLSSDDSMVRRAIEDFADSGDFDGLVEARSPSAAAPQYIPGFALYWIYMIADHLMLQGDRNFSSRFLPRIDAVFTAYERALTADGYVAFTGAQYWNFVDWTPQWQESRGVPNTRDDGANTIVTLMYAVALQQAAFIARECGLSERADAYSTRAATIADDALRNSLDVTSGLYADYPGGAPESVHAQVWAVLSKRLDRTDAQRVLRAALNDPDLARCSYAMAVPQIEALEATDLSELVDWAPWAAMLEQNLTTWAEDATTLRSDCHAWGAVPLLYFPRFVLGTSPLEPGWARIRIAPNMGTRTHASGVIPTPHGPLRITATKHEGSMEVAVDAPADTGIMLPADATVISRRTDKSAVAQALVFSLPQQPHGTAVFQEDPPSSPPLSP